MKIETKKVTEPILRNEDKKENRPKNMETIDEILTHTSIENKKDNKLTIVDIDYEKKTAFNSKNNTSNTNKKINDKLITEPSNNKKATAVSYRSSASPVNAKSKKRKEQLQSIITSEVTALDNRKKKNRLE